MTTGYFPDIDSYWQEVVDFLGEHAIDPARVIAPRGFGDHLPGATAYDEVEDDLLGDMDTILFHKGLVDQIPRHVQRSALHSMVPTFANPVFVIYARDFLEPMASSLHLHALFERLDMGEIAAPVSKLAPLLVHDGNDRMICRDVAGRKIIVPSRHAALIGALIASRNVVTDLRKVIGPALAGASLVVDNGAGIGLFALAAREAMPETAKYVALEGDDADRGALIANVELGGFYWRTQFLKEHPPLLRPVSQQSLAQGEGGQVWIAGGNTTSPEATCDLMHIDADIGKAAQKWVSFAAKNRVPTIVLSRGLSSRPHDSTTGMTGLEAKLSSAGYDLAIDSGDRLALGAVRVWRLV